MKQRIGKRLTVFAITCCVAFSNISGFLSYPANADTTENQTVSSTNAEKPISAEAPTAFPEVISADDIDAVPSGEIQNYLAKRNLASMSQAAAPSIAAQNAQDTDIPEGDGTTIESIQSSWIDINGNMIDTNGDGVINDSDYLYTDKLAKDGSDGSNNEVSEVRDKDGTYVRMRVDIALSGEHNYDSGNIQITLPKTIFKDRNGNSVGEMSFSVPEETDARTSFNYADMGDYYVITNVKKLPAATNAYFEFTISGLTPHMMQDMSTGYMSDIFQPKITVTTENGVVLQKTSNAIQANFDTYSKVQSAEKRNVDLSDTWNTSYPSVLKPDNANDYIYTDWYTYAYVSPYSTQAYSLHAEDDPDASADVAGEDASAVHPLILGAKVMRDNKVYKADNGFLSVPDLTAYANENTQYMHFYVAYPKKDFESGKKYTIKNTVKYTLTDTDDLYQTTAEKEASVMYAPVKFTGGTGFSSIQKWGISTADIPSRGVTITGASEGEGRSISGATKTRYGDIQGMYGYALTQLQNGSDTEVAFQTNTTAFGEPYTYKDNGDGVTDQNDYGQVPYTVVTEDGDLSLDEISKLETEDYEFSAINFTAPYFYRYEKASRTVTGYYEAVNSSGQTYPAWGQISAGSYGYTRIDYKKDHIFNGEDNCTFSVYGKINGEWVDLGTVNYASGSPVFSCRNGSSVDTDNPQKLNLPENVTSFRVSLSTKQSAVKYYLYPVIKLKHESKNVSALVDRLFKLSDQPTAELGNTAEMRILNPDGNSLGSARNSARDELASVQSAVVTNKEYVQDSIKNDPAKREASFLYRITTFYQTNLSSFDEYQKAQKDGVFQKEGSGTWYDLLPKGMTLDTDNIRASGAEITSIKLIDNFRNTGRTLAIIKGNITRSVASIYTDKVNNLPFGNQFIGSIIAIDLPMIYSWESAAEYGREVTNIVAYESGMSVQGTYKNYAGEPDNPNGGKSTLSRTAFDGVSEDIKKAMTNLDEKRDDPSFSYASARTTLAIDLAADAGLTKKVAVNGNGYYSDGQDIKLDSGKLQQNPMNVYENGSYTYRLMIKNSEQTKSKDLVFYDNLETFVPRTSADDPTQTSIDKNDIQWKGHFKGVDASTLALLGCKPVVYYSTKDNLTLNDPDHRENNDLSDTSIWTKADSYTGNLGDVKAIAVDASKTPDGSDFVLNPSRSVWIYINMQAPDLVKDGYASEDEKAKWYDTNLSDSETEAGLTGGAHAYNEAVRIATIIGRDGTEQVKTLLSNAYTKVGIVPMRINVKKVWNDENDNDKKRPESVTVHLYGDGEDLNKAVTLSESDKWEGSFENVCPLNADGDPVYFSMREDSVHGYGSPIITLSRNADGTVSYTITNHRDPERESFLVQKAWNDDNDKDEKRPSGINAYLLKKASDGTWQFLSGWKTGNIPVWSSDLNSDAQKQSKYVTGSSSDNTWTAQWANLLKYNNGVKNEYKVLENPVKDEKTGDYVNGYIPGYASSSSNVTERNDSLMEQTITNSEVPGSLEIKKTLENATEEAKKTEFTFDFHLYNANKSKELSGEYPYTVKHSDGSSDTMGTIYPGGTFTMKGGDSVTITGLPSESKYQLTEEDAQAFEISASNNTEGQIRAGQAAQVSFTNTYCAKGKFYPRFLKTLSGREMKAHEFSFRMYDSTGKEIRRTTNTADGNINFGAITYTQSDDGKTYTYTASEIVPDDAVLSSDHTVTYAAASDTQKKETFARNGVTYTNATYEIDVSVKDKGDGTMDIAPTYYAISEDGSKTKLKSSSDVVFANVYEAKGNVSFTAYKQMKGGSNVPDEKFSFRLKDEKGNVLETVKNKYDTISFSPIEFANTWTVNQNNKEITTIGKTYTFTAEEVKGEDPNYVYDTNKIVFTATPKDNGDGTLDFDTDWKVIDKDGNTVSSLTSPTFVNTPADGSLTVSKEIANGDPDTEFRFRLKLKGDDADGKTYKMAKNDIAGDPKIIRVKIVDADGKQLSQSVVSQYDISAYEKTSSGNSYFCNNPIAPDKDGYLYLSGKSGSNEPVNIYGSLYFSSDTSMVQKLPEYEPTVEKNQYGTWDLSTPEVAILQKSNDGFWNAVLTAPLRKKTDTNSTSSSAGTAIVKTAAGRTTNSNVTSENIIKSIYGTIGEKKINVKAVASTAANTHFTRDQLEGNAFAVLTDDDGDGIKETLHIIRSKDDVQIEGKSIFSAIFSNDNANHVKTTYADYSQQGITSVDGKTYKGYVYTPYARWPADPSYNRNDWHMPWADHVQDITKVIFENPFQPGGVDNRINDTRGFQSFFRSMSNLTDIENLGTMVDTSHQTTFDNLFNGCSSLTEIPGIGNLDISNVSSLYATFNNCSRLDTLPISSWTSSKISQLGRCFDGCTSLRELDIHGFDTSHAGKYQQNAEDARFWRAFYNMSSLKSLDISGIDTTNYNEVRDLINADSLEKLTIGENFKAKTISGINSFAASGNLDGNHLWVRDDYAYGPFPISTILSWRSSDYDGSVMAGTYILYTPSENTKYTIRYDANGGSGTIADESIQYAEDHTVSGGSGFARLNYTLAGWNTQEDGSGTTYTLGGNIAGKTYKPGNMVTLYAQWTQNENVKAKDGIIEFTLHGNEQATFNGLQGETQFEIEELTSAGWVLVNKSGSAGVIKANQNEQISFLNKYEPEVTQVTLHGQKYINGEATAKYRFYTSGSNSRTEQDYTWRTFNFSVQDENGNEVAVGSNATEDGEIQFTPISISSPGKKTWKVKETTDDPAFEKNNEVITISTEVTQDENGNLQAGDLTYTDADGNNLTGCNFHNTMKKEVSFYLEKDVVDDENNLTKLSTDNPYDKDAGFHFHIKCSDSSYDQDITLSHKKGERYINKEVTFPYGSTIWVSEEEQPGFQLIHLTQSDDAIFQYTDDNTIMLHVGSAGNDIKIYNKPVEDTYTSTGTAILKAKKVIADAQRKPLNHEFEFLAFEANKNTDGSYTPVKQADVMYNDSQGNIISSPLTYTLKRGERKTVYYEMQEVANGFAGIMDTTPRYAEVTFSDNGKGSAASSIRYFHIDPDTKKEIEDPSDGPTFINKQSTTSIIFTKSVENETKAIEGRSYQFKFTAQQIIRINGESLQEDLQGSYTYKYGKYENGSFVENESRESGKLSNGDTISLKSGEAIQISGIPDPTVYKFSEQTLSGFVISGTNLEGTARANKENVASATNTYTSSGTWSPSVSKKLRTLQSIDTGDLELEEGEFTFHLTDVTDLDAETLTRGNITRGTEVESAVNGKDGTVSFTPVSYTQADDGKTYTYAIWEDIPENKDPQMEYDKNIHIVKVTPHDNGDGTMAIDTVYDGGNGKTIAFVNNYISQPVPTGVPPLAGSLELAVTAAATVGCALYEKKRRKKKN